MGIVWGGVERELYAFFSSKGLCKNGIFGLFGNLYAESGMNPKNLQNSSEKKLGLTDEAYTAAVDNGNYKNFVHDSAGYGLAQWTYWSRKEAMLAFHQAKGVSIGDALTQAEFLYKELSESFPAVLKVLKTAASIREASDAVLLQFEKPKDQSEAVRKKRASYGQQYAELYEESKEGGSGMTETQARQKVVGIMQGWVGLKRSDRSHAPIIDTYNEHTPRPRGYKVSYTDAYCATTTSAAAIKAGFTDIIPVECSCYYLIEKAKAMGIWQENDAHVPKMGDEVLYDWDDGPNYATTDNQGAPEHVGMVEAISGSTIRVIEGNMSGGVVGRRNLQINGRYIRGFICPDYASKATKQEPDAPQPGSTATGGGLSRDAKWKGKTTTALKVRKWAGTENGECSFSPLKDGEEISVCDEIQAADGSRWYYIKNKAGKYGFASAKYITAAGAGASAAPVSFKAGDKVKVTGTFYGNGNGTGGAIKKTGATMYVTELVDKAKYKYYIGLAAKKGGVRQGWAEPSILKKI